MSEVSMRENVPLLAYSPMAFGLSGKYHKGLTLQMIESINFRLYQDTTVHLPD